MNLKELRAKLRELGLPTDGRKSELEQRLADDARSKALDKDSVASSIEGVEDTLVQGAEKPDRMKEVRREKLTSILPLFMQRSGHFHVMLGSLGVRTRRFVRRHNKDLWPARG
jgi:hypothetical protein